MTRVEKLKPLTPEFIKLRDPNPSLTLDSGRIRPDSLGALNNLRKYYGYYDKMKVIEGYQY